MINYHLQRNDIFNMKGCFRFYRMASSQLCKREWILTPTTSGTRYSWRHTHTVSCSCDRDKNCQVVFWRGLDNDGNLSQKKSGLGFDSFFFISGTFICICRDFLLFCCLSCPLAARLRYSDGGFSCGFLGSVGNMGFNDHNWQ